MNSLEASNHNSAPNCMVSNRYLEIRFALLLDVLHSESRPCIPHYLGALRKTLVLEDSPAHSNNIHSNLVLVVGRLHAHSP